MKRKKQLRRLDEDQAVCVCVLGGLHSEVQQMACLNQKFLLPRLAYCHRYCHFSHHLKSDHFSSLP